MEKNLLIPRSLLKWSRKLHRWVGIYISILTMIWLVEMMVLPLIFNSGLPIVDGLSATARSTSAPLSLQHALESFIEQQPPGISSVDELDEMTYLPKKGVYRFAVKNRFLEWYVEAGSGKILKYGFNSNRFIMEKGMLGWIHPIVTKIVKTPFEFLFIFLTITGCYIVFYSRKKKKRQTKKQAGSVLDMVLGQSKFLKEIQNVTLMGRLAAVGLLPGVKIRIIRTNNKGPVVITARKTLLALGQGIAGQIKISDAKV